MSWPVSQDYNEAVQNPSTSFGDAELAGATAMTNALGLPMPRSGSFADVYEMRRGEARWAVKCFTREVPGLRERYAAISAHLQQARLPFTVDFNYLSEGIRIRGRWYPVLKMQWVEGFLLNEFVRDNLDHPVQLGRLGVLWRRMAVRLREAGAAHGDLQHGNVLLVPGSRAASLALKLIDYDGMFVPALAGRPSGEAGHPSYQHPQRLREATYGPEVDRFPLLVVATALRCLAVGGRDLWGPFDTGDNLLFRQADLRAPHASPLFRELERLADPVARALVDRLAEACREPLDRAPRLDDLLGEELLAVRAPVAARRAAGPARDADEPPVTDVELVLGPAPSRPRRRPRVSTTPIIAGVVALVLLLTAGALLIALAMRAEPLLVEGPARGDTAPGGEPEEVRTAMTARATPLPPTPSPARPVGQRPVPAPAAVAAAEARLKSLFRAELQRREPAAQRELIDRLLQEGRAPEAEPDLSYVWLREASLLSARIADLDRAFRAADDTAARFLVRAAVLKAEALETAAEPTPPGGPTRALVARGLALVENARQRDEYDDALRLLAAVQKIVPRAQDPALEAYVEARVKPMERLARECATLLAGFRARRRDREALLSAGMFLGFHKGDWKRGLPLLAQGSDTELAALARQDLGAAKQSPTIQAAIADAWWTRAEEQTGEPHRHLTARARHWYARAWPGLPEEARRKAALRVTETVGGREVRPGLFATFQGTGDETPTLRARLDDQLDFPAGNAPRDDALPVPLTEARWQGWLVPLVPGVHRLAVRAAGEVRLRIDDEELRLARAGGRLVADCSLDRPLHRIEVVYRPEKATPALQLLWSREGLVTDAVVPAEALFHGPEQEKWPPVRDVENQQKR